MERLKLLKRKNILFTWIMSYTLILLIPVIVSITIYPKIEKQIEDEINKANNFYLVQTQQYVDGIIDEVKKTSMTIAFEPYVQYVVDCKGSFSSEEYFQIYETSKIMRNSSINDFQSNNIYMFFKNQNTILSSVGNRDIKTFYDIYSSLDDKYYNSWIDMLNGQYRGKFISVKDISNGMKIKDSKIYYILSLPVIRQGRSLANLVITIDKSKLMKLCNDVKNTNKGQFIILDEDNNIIFNSDEGNEPKGIKYDDFIDYNSKFYKDHNNEEVVISHINSNVEKLKYIYIVPKNSFLAKLKYVRKIIYLSTLFSIILGSVIVYFLLMKNYSPIKKLLNRFGANKFNFRSEINEYQFIENTIVNAISEKEQVEKKLMEQNIVLKTRFIERLIKGNYDEAIVNDSLVSYDIQFQSKYFGVLLFYIDKFNQKLLESICTEDFSATKVINFVLNNIIQDLSINNFKCFLTECDGMTALIVNVKESNKEQQKSDIKRLAIELQDFIKEYYKINLTIAVSGIHETIKGIKTCYKETLEAMDYKIIMGIDGIIDIDETKDSNKIDYYYPLEKEQQIINYIKDGDFQNTELTIEYVFNNNFEDKKISPQIANMLIVDIISTLLKAVHELNPIMKEETPEILAQIEKLIQYKNIDIVKQNIINLLNELCTKVIDERKRKNYDIKDKVETYINDNYMDENLSIAMIAEQFGMSPYYISKLYKIQSGEGVLEYINKVRVEKSKQILIEQKLTIEEVCKAVGYFNVRTFSRAFAKLEGVTPGKYKDNYQS